MTQGAPHDMNEPAHRLGDTPAGLPTHMPLALRLQTAAADVNVNGDIFGGWIMSHVDIAGSIIAFRVAKGRCSTVGVKEFDFKEPLSVGDVVSFYAAVRRIGRTSITVDVEVWAERNPAAPTVVKVTEATITYVAIDATGRPRPVPAG